jgi:GNAT superfamily N-acetyltransferase
MITYPKTLTFLRHTVFPPSRSDHLKRLKFYYIFFLGSLPSSRGRGLGGAFISHCQAKASADGVPIYLECSTDRTRLFYERLGFKSVCVVRCGKGEVDEEGYVVDVKKDGVSLARGVKLWPMIWWPEGMWPEGVQYWDGKSEMEVK